MGFYLSICQDLQLVRKFTNLKVLKILVQKDAHEKIRFLDDLPNLKQLQIISNGSSVSSPNWQGYNWMNFCNAEHPSLEVLELNNVGQSNANSPRCNWFEKFPNLTTVRLEQCVVNHQFWNDLCGLRLLKHLECLNVHERPAAGQRILLKVSNEMLQQLEKSCPQLEDVVENVNVIYKRYLDF